MAMFQLDVAWLLEVAIFAAGLVVLHFARQSGASLLRTAGWVLLVGSVSAAACSIYFASRYHAQGEFDHAYPQMAHPMMGAGSREMTAPFGSPEPATPQGGTSGEHEGHHPGEAPN